MAKKKKQNQPPRHTKARFGDALAAQLQQLQLDVAPAEEEAPAPLPARAEPEPALTVEAFGGPLSDEELFAHAVDQIGPADLYRGKYTGAVRELPKQPEGALNHARVTSKESPSSSTPTTSSIPEVDEARAREAAKELRDEALFAAVIGPVDRMTDGKYHVPEQDPHRVFGAADSFPYTTEEVDGFITPLLPKSGEGLHQVGPLEKSQRGLLKRAQFHANRHGMPSVNVRGDVLEDALRQLELFMHHNWKEGERYVRVVHGRGLQSEEGAVLKPAVLRWLEGPGFRYVRGYAPELTQSGDYGSLIVAIKPRQDADT